MQRWDAENDIVVLAKEMCMMMIDMSDFTRWVIKAVHVRLGGETTG